MWELADALGIHDSSLSRKLRRELSQEEKALILRTIDQMEVRDETISENS